jgi:hypothetical protein
VRVGRELVDQQAAVLVVDVDQRQARPVTREELALRGEVVVQVGVEVEVVAAQVEEDGDVEDHAVDPAEHECVAGDLHRAGVDLPLDHQREEPVQVGRLGRGQRRLDVDPVDPGAHRPDHGGRNSGGLQRELGQARGRGLALGAGHRDQPQVAGGVAVDVGRERAENGARVGHDEHRHVEIGDQLGAGRIGHDRDGTRLDRGCGVRRAVGTRARQRGVQVAGVHALGAQRNARDASGADVNARVRQAEPGRNLGQRSAVVGDRTWIGHWVLPQVVSYGVAARPVGGTA